MASVAKTTVAEFPRAVLARGEGRVFSAGDQVRVSVRFPVGHYSVPR